MKENIYEIKNGKGIQQEYIYSDKFYVRGEFIQFEGEYLNGKRNGKGKEYWYTGNLSFEGEYLNGKRNGKGKEFWDNGKLIFEGEYVDGKKKGKGKEFKYSPSNINFSS